VPTAASHPSGDGEGLRLFPFVATRYSDPRQLPALSSPAYDLIAPDERESLAQADAHSIVHLTLPTFGAADAKRRLRAWRREGVLVPDPEPALYIYDLADLGSGSRRLSTRGWVGAVDLVPPGSPAISPHEATMPAPVADRLRLLAATQSNLEPIVLTHDGPPGIADELSHTYVDSAEPIVDLLDETRIRHRLWRVCDSGDVRAVCADFAGRRAVIADGHHRYESYLGYQSRQHATAAGDGPWDRALVLLVPTQGHGPQVRAIHRVVPDLPLDRAVRVASAAFRATQFDPLSAAEAEHLLTTAPETTVLLTDGSDWVALTDPDRASLLDSTPPDLATAWGELDVALVDAGLIEDLWAASSTVTLRHSVSSAVAAAIEGSGVAVLVRPTAAATVLALAAQGILMPRKSTFFVPKPRTGLVMRCMFDEIDYPQQMGLSAP